MKLLHASWLLMFATASVAQPQVWLGPRAVDFIPIIEGSEPEAPWNAVADRVAVMEIPQNFVRKLPAETLSRLVQDLHRRHIALALGILPINWFHETPCGQGIEGYSDPGSARDAVAKLKAAGAEVDLISMDEPFWFGHFYSGKNACRSSLDELAERNAVLVKIFTAAYPDAAIVDTEPFPAVSSQPGWAAAYADWLTKFREATGSPVTALHLDFNWGDPRLNTGEAHDGSNAAAVGALVRQVAQMAQHNSLKIGMIYWGGGGRGSGDGPWMDEARLHIREVLAAGVPLDHAIFTSWNPAPAHTFPVSDPAALASLIPYFAQQRRETNEEGGR